MKKVFLSLMVVLMGGLLTLPSVEAQGRREGSSHGQTAVGQRPGRGGSGHGNSRPGSHDSRPGSGGGMQSPGRPATRPGGGGSHTMRPGGGSDYRPGNGNHKPSAPSYRPGNGGGNHRPGNMYPGARPGHRHPTAHPKIHPSRPGWHRPVVVAPPIRPGRPHFNAWVRPVPPGSWRPVYRHAIVPNILGMAFGLTINSALDYLYNGGYSVDGYGRQEVYLRNVNEAGYYWDDATLYFGSNGLVRSQFYESSAGYGTSRFYGVYNRLTSQYGVPVSQSNNGNAITATWFGYQGDYITLQYTLMNSSSGYRYFTILTYGN